MLNFSRAFDNLKQLSRHASSRDFIDIAWNELYLLQRLFFFHYTRWKIFNEFWNYRHANAIWYWFETRESTDFLSFFYTILKVFHWVLFEHIRHLFLHLLLLSFDIENQCLWRKNNCNTQTLRKSSAIWSFASLNLKSWHDVAKSRHACQNLIDT